VVVVQVVLTFVVVEQDVDVDVTSVLDVVEQDVEVEE
jgi:hypothetical protein